MSAYFFDSSALVKRYVRETGTVWVTDILNAPTRNQIYVARITGVEVTSAITRRARSGSLLRDDASAALSLFQYEFSNDFTITEIIPSLINRAMQLAESHALRGYDAVQLGATTELHRSRSALSLSPLTLISADQELNAAALAEGIDVDDPATHP